ncbi:Disease resistance protein [Melia azedarach]|uniref:Disease resistance protein n=1 Tax=Melia azedarach TaxID=155640 RepID=A0ACC1YF29_MELAZ|nr:Disease resistance protein [Melia azedarach]
MLKNVFPVSIASNLSQLESLEIGRCGVEEIVSVASEGAETKHRFVFPRVITLTLFDLPKFTTFFPGLYTTEWPVLKELKVSGWKILTSLGRKQVSHRESEVQPRFLVEKRFHCMKELLIQGQSYILKTRDENEVSVMKGDLNRCSNLKHILEKESNMDHLVFLQVFDCNNLTNIIRSSTSFRNLTTLEVKMCYKLTNVLTSSTARSLVQLRKMEVSFCNMLTEVVAADEGDGAKDYEIVFSELKRLRLEFLDNLTSFCSANYALKLPSLEELILDVKYCPKMKTFLGGELSTPKLQKVKLRLMDEDGALEG